MKYSKCVFMAVLMVAITNSCNKKTAPADVAKNWLNDYHKMDFEDAKRYSTDETRNTLALAEMFLPSLSDSAKKLSKDVTINIKGTKQTGDNAVVIYTVSKNPNREENLKLIRKDNVWLVQFTKNDMNASVQTDTIANIPIGVDSTAQISITPGVPDSTNTPPGDDTERH